MEDCSRRWLTKGTSACLPDDLRVERRPNGFLMERCRADAENAKTPEVYTKLPPLDMGISFPMNAVVNDEMYRGESSVPAKSRTEGILQRERFVGCQGSVRTSSPQPGLCGRPTESPREFPDAFRIEVIEVHLRSGLRLAFLPLHRVGSRHERGGGRVNHFFRNGRYLNNRYRVRGARHSPATVVTG